MLGIKCAQLSDATEEIINRKSNVESLFSKDKIDLRFSVIRMSQCMILDQLLATFGIALVDDLFAASNVTRPGIGRHIILMGGFQI